VGAEFAREAKSITTCIRSSVNSAHVPGPRFIPMQQARCPLITTALADQHQQYGGCLPVAAIPSCSIAQSD
jgi:hypothetical protein